jgi:Protein of unknown function (DUF3631)
VMSTEAILANLHAIEESPWSDIHGKPLNSRGLANRLRQYGIRSKNVRIGLSIPKGYARADLHDAWVRYLGPPPYETATSATAATSEESA